MPANPERGEVAFTVGSEKGVVCAEMGRLAALSHMVGTKSLRELFERIGGVEPFTIFASIDCMLVDGDAKAIKAAMASPQALATVSGAVMKSLESFTSKNG